VNDINLAIAFFDTAQADIGFTHRYSPNMQDPSSQKKSIARRFNPHELIFCVKTISEFSTLKSDLRFLSTSLSGL